MSEIEHGLLSLHRLAAEMVCDDMGWFVFGSAVRDLATARDVDLLLVYQVGAVSRATIVATAIRNLSLDFDVLSLSERGVQELDVVDVLRVTRPVRARA